MSAGSTDVVVRLASGLRAHAGGSATVTVAVPARFAGEAVTVAHVLEAVAVAHPAVGRRVCDETGALRQHVNVFVGVDNIRDLDGLRSVVAAGAEVALLAAVSGG